MKTYLEHHGIIGMRWGVRRYQNKDGSLTKAGKKHRDLGLKIASDKKHYYTGGVNMSKMGLDDLEYYNKKRASFGSEKEAKSYGYKRRPYSEKDLKKQAIRYAYQYLSKTTWETIEKSMSDNTLQVGKDYLNGPDGGFWRQHSHAKLSEIYQQSVNKTEKDLKDIVDKYDLSDWIDEQRKAM